MKIEFESEKVNRLLHRTELVCKIDTGGVTPSRKDLTAQVAAKKGVKDALVVVDNIGQEFGHKFAKAYVKVYESEKAAQAAEPKHLFARGKPKAAKEAEAPAEPKKEAK